jgi:protein TonB
LIWGCFTTLAVHLGAAAVLAHVPTGGWRANRVATVELDVVEKPLPPPEPVPPPPVPPENKPTPPVPVARSVVRRALSRPALPPPPNRETPPAPPTAEPPPPVFGVTAESVVAGESAVAVPIGNTLMTKDRTPAKAAPLPLPAADPDAFAPVADNLIAQFPASLGEVKAEYPEEAKRMGIEGRVKLRVSLDRQGHVRSVRVAKRAGNGFDEAAKQALMRMRFSPARTADGRAVDWEFTYDYGFELRQ